MLVGSKVFDFLESTMIRDPLIGRINCMWISNTYLSRFHDALVSKFPKRLIQHCITVPFHHDLYSDRCPLPLTRNRILTCFYWPFPWRETHCSKIQRWKYNVSLWCLYWPSTRSSFGSSIYRHDVHTRWNSVGILFRWLLFENLWHSRSRSWPLAFHSWIWWAYAARHGGWMGDGSGWWAAVLGPSRAQGTYMYVTVQSGGWGSLNELNNTGLV